MWFYIVSFALLLWYSRSVWSFLLYSWFLFQCPALSSLPPFIPLWLCISFQSFVWWHFWFYFFFLCLWELPTVERLKRKIFQLKFIWEAFLCPFFGTQRFEDVLFWFVPCAAGPELCLSVALAHCHLEIIITERLAALIKGQLRHWLTTTVSTSCAYEHTLEENMFSKKCCWKRTFNRLEPWRWGCSLSAAYHERVMKRLLCMQFLFRCRASEASTSGLLTFVSSRAVEMAPEWTPWSF